MLVNKGLSLQHLRGLVNDRFSQPPFCRIFVGTERIFIDNLLVRFQFIIVAIRWTGLAPREFEFPFPGSPRW